jgi:hypothetical protein
MLALFMWAWSGTPGVWSSKAERGLVFLYDYKKILGFWDWRFKLLDLKPLHLV